MINIYTVNTLPVSNENENLSIKTSLSLLFNVRIPSLEDMSKIDVAKIKVIFDLQRSQFIGNIQYFDDI